MTIERTTLDDGSVCIVERHDGEHLALVAREVDGVVVWNCIYPTDDTTDYVATAVSAMTDQPDVFDLPDSVDMPSVEAALALIDAREAEMPEPDYSPRLVVDRDDDGVAVSALGVSPSGRPFAVEWDPAHEASPNLFEQLQDLGFDRPTIEAAYDAARTTHLAIGDAFEGADDGERERPEPLAPAPPPS